MNAKIVCKGIKTHTSPPLAKLYEAWDSPEQTESKLISSISSPTFLGMDTSKALSFFCHSEYATNRILTVLEEISLKVESAANPTAWFIKLQDLSLTLCCLD